MNKQMNDTRLSPNALEEAVDFAYGGAAVRAGRAAQARAVANFFRRKAKTVTPASGEKGESDKG